MLRCEAHAAAVRMCSRAAAAAPRCGPCSFAVVCAANGGVQRLYLYVRKSSSPPDVVRQARVNVADLHELAMENLAVERGIVGHNCWDVSWLVSRGIRLLQSWREQNVLAADQAGRRRVNITNRRH